MIRELFRYVIKRYDRINGPLLAKGLGFSLIIGILPLIFIALSVGAYILDVTSEQYREVWNGLAELIPPDILRNYLSSVLEFSQNWRSLGVATLIFFVLFSFNLFNSLGRVLRTILSRRKSTVTRNNLISLLFLSTSLLLFYASMIIGPNLSFLEDLIPLTGDVAAWADSLIDIVVYAFILMVLYYIYSNRSINRIPTLIVAFLSGAILENVTSLGVFIIRSMTRRFSLFGAMAAPIMLMMYLRIFAEILIFSSLIVDFYSSKLVSAYQPQLPGPATDKA